MIINTKTADYKQDTGYMTASDNHRATIAKSNSVYDELENSMFFTLETYSNVHRGSGHFSKATTQLYEKAREIVIDFLGLKRAKYIVIFCTPRRLAAFLSMLKPGSFKTLHSSDYDLNLGVAALAIRKKALPDKSCFETGGGTTKLYGADWVMWAKAPDRFEAGTPAIINVIAFAKALLMMKQSGSDIFREKPVNSLDAWQILYKDELAKYSGRELLFELRKTLIGSDVQVPTTRGLQSFINLDSSASTQTFTPVWHAFIQTYCKPESARKEIIGEVKRICAEMMGAPLSDHEVFFTSNTTESINLVAQSLARETNDGFEPVILTSTLEHSSNDLPWRNVAGHSIIRLGVDNKGYFDLKELESLLQSYNTESHYGNKRIKLLAISGASNVLGSCNDLPETGKLARKYGVRFLVDAAQLVAHRKTDMQAAGIDYMVFSAHKIYAPFGTGVIIARKGLLQLDDKTNALLNASALENAGGIAALGKAILLLNRIGFEVIEEEEKWLRAKALQAMAQIPGVNLHGVSPDDLLMPKHRIGVIGFDLKDKMSSGVAGKLARRGGIGVRFGCLCAHLIIKQLAGFTPFQEKMQRFVLRLIPIINLQGITRVSFGIQNTEAEVEALIHELKKIAGVSGNEASGTNTVRTSDAITSIPEKVVKQQIMEFTQTRELLVYG